MNALAGNQQSDEPLLQLCLYVLGSSRQSDIARQTLSHITEKTLKTPCRLQIIDIAEEPEAAERDGIIAVPVLVKKAPGPEKRILGDLSEEEEVLKALELPSAIWTPRV